MRYDTPRLELIGDATAIVLGATDSQKPIDHYSQADVTLLGGPTEFRQVGFEILDPDDASIVGAYTT